MQRSLSRDCCVFGVCGLRWQGVFLPFSPIFASFVVVVVVVVCVGFGFGFEVCKFAVCVFVNVRVETEK